LPAATCGSGSVSDSLHHCKDHIGRWISYQTARRDGSTHIVMSPLESMQRLAALVPRPRLHLIRLHRVLALNIELRAMVVPAGPQEPNGESELAATKSGCAHGRRCASAGPGCSNATLRSTSSTAPTAAATDGY